MRPSLFQVRVGTQSLGNTPSPVDNLATSNLDIPLGIAPADGSYPIMVDVQGDGYSEGSMTLYVWYVQ